jgi:hypothetical protein
MKAHNCRPDSVVYNTIIGALWKTGLVWAQVRRAPEPALLLLLLPLRLVLLLRGKGQRKGNLAAQRV